jgi:hypothetical protein
LDLLRGPRPCSRLSGAGPGGHSGGHALASAAAVGRASDGDRARCPKRDDQRSPTVVGLAGRGRAALVAPDGGSCLLALKNCGGPFSAWATVFERTSDRIRARFEPRFPHVWRHRWMSPHLLATAAARSSPWTACPTRTSPGIWPPVWSTWSTRTARRTQPAQSTTASRLCGKWCGFSPNEGLPAGRPSSGGGNSVLPFDDVPIASAGQ